MDLAEIIHGIGETVSAGATVKSVYGEPVTVGQRTILPVATVRFSFGGGGGAEGGGAGARVSAQPCGIVEVTPEGARFLYFQDPGRLAAVVAAAFLVGFALGFTRGRKDKQKSV
jgi:uncharacterized spore protein YtfJ